MATGLVIKKMTFNAKALAAYSAAAIDGAMEKMGIQMLDWMASGSPTSPTRPPIRTGVLSASGSVFLGSKMLTTTENIPHSGPSEANTSHVGKDKTLTFGFNTAYAAKMHEDSSLNPGPFSAQSGDRHPGNQWVTAHLKADAQEFLKGIAAFLRGKF